MRRRVASRLRDVGGCSLLCIFPAKLKIVLWLSDLDQLDLRTDASEPVPGGGLF